MNGTNRKNFGKSGRSGAVLTLACLFIMAMTLAFTACEEKEESDPIASEFQGDYRGTYKGDLVKGTSADADATFTVSASAITGPTITISNVSTSGGGSLSMSGTPVGSWVYVLEGSTKIGAAYAVTTEDGPQTSIVLGASTVATFAGFMSLGGVTGFTAADVAAVTSTTYEGSLDKE